ncbi:hypothetical protein ACP4OV_024928 [Aristida adscensionis]
MIPVATEASPYFPPEPIPEIASRLTSLQDFFALRAACRAYRDHLPLTPSNLASQAPLLLVPHKDTGSQALFHLRRRILRFRLRVPLGIEHNYRDTSFHPLGCRVAIYDEMYQLSRRQLRIVHLLTGVETQLPSPPRCISRVLLSGDLVLAWWEFNRIIQYCRIDDSGWRVASMSEPYLIEDLIFANGNLYALVTPGYRLAVVKLQYSSGSVDLTFLGDCGGELMLISVWRLYLRVYHVFRWQEGKWARITSLGGFTLFLADYRFAGSLGPNHRGIRHDCIYFTEAIRGEEKYQAIVMHPFGSSQACVDTVSCLREALVRRVHDHNGASFG